MYPFMTLPVHVHIIITINRQRFYCSTCTQMHLFISIPVQFISSFFGMTCTVTYPLICWGMYTQILMLLLCLRTNTYLSPQLLVYLLLKLGCINFFFFFFFLMSQADWEPLSTCWSHPAWSSGCPTGTHCTPPKPHKLAKQLPVCSVHFTRLLPGGCYFYFYTSLMGPRHPTAARWNKQF